MCAEEIQDAAMICRHCGAQVTPAGWVQPAPQQARTSTNGFAIASMVLGIVWIYWIGSILALVFGYVAWRQIRDSMGRQGGDGMAIAGIVLGWIGVGVIAIIIVIAVVAAGTDDGNSFDSLFVKLL